MSLTKYPKAYEAYQQAVYRDGRNPTFWCSIGVLYYQINQYRDALDAYSRAIRLNPYISEVWYDLGTLYESCNNQIADALDAYGRAADLDPSNVHIKTRLQLLQTQLSTGTAGQQANVPAPQPQDVHPQAYQPPGVGVPPAPQWGAPAPIGPAAQAPAPPRSIPDWNRGINEIQSQGPPSNSLDQRDARLPGVPAQSPRQEPGRAFPDPRLAGHSPKTEHNPYLPSHTLPQITNAPPPGHERAPSGGTTFGGPRSGPPAPPGASSGAPPPTYQGRPFSPAPPIRPIDERPSSPGSGYPHQQFHPGPTLPPQVPGGNSIASGAPAPPSAAAAADAAARDRDDRPTSAMKRSRGWEPEVPIKRPANEENRARLDEQSARRAGSPAHVASPSGMQRRSSSEARRDDARREDARRANENYHPSEAAHHPPTLPSIQDMPPHPSAAPSLPPMTEGSGPASNGPPPSGPASANTPVKEEAPRPEAPPAHEPAARKMDVDEDYDDDVEEEKKVAAASKGSPNGSAAGNPANGTGARPGTPSKPEPSA